MNLKINPLSKSTLKLHVDDFVSMSNRTIEDEYWGSEHFLADLPGKWELSFSVADDAGKLAAFLIASEKKDSVHIHKFVVDKPYQQMGLGSRMLSYLKEKNTKPLTLKVHVDNLHAIDFYTRKGFTTLSIEKDLCLMKMS